MGEAENQIKNKLVSLLLHFKNAAAVEHFHAWKFGGKPTGVAASSALKVAGDVCGKAVSFITRSGCNQVTDGARDGHL
jgi:hypothetical protein